MKELGQSLKDIFWWRSYEAILKRPVSEWNRRDCLTVMMQNMRNNVLDNRTNIKVYATPYCPPVIAAMTKFRWLQIPVPRSVAESDFESLLIVFAMFKIKEGNYSFVENSENISLCIKGLESDIRLNFPVNAFEDMVKLR